MNGKMITISQLAKRFGLSRTSILYYEREGLLLPASRSENGYRWYGDKEISRLEMILAYRSFGLPVAKLEPILDREGEASQEHILRDQFNALEQEIQRLRLQQKAIVQFLEAPELLEEQGIDKDRWTGIMQAAGLSEDDMLNWHSQFEVMEPQAHQEFLESLSIDAKEIEEIRAWSKQAKQGLESD